MKTSRNKHSRLRESMDCEQGNDGDQEVTLAKEEESLSSSSTTTLTQQETSNLANNTVSETEEITITCSLPTSPQIHENKTVLKRSSTLSSDKDRNSEKDSVTSTTTLKDTRRLSNVSTVTMTNVRNSSERCTKSDPVNVFYKFSVSTSTIFHSFFSPEHFQTLYS